MQDQRPEQPTELRAVILYFLPSLPQAAVVAVQTTQAAVLPVRLEAAEVAVLEEALFKERAALAIRRLHHQAKETPEEMGSLAHHFLAAAAVALVR